MPTVQELFDILGEKKGKGGKFATLPQRAVSRVQSPFLKRYLKKGGEINGNGKSATYQTELGVNVLESTIKHMKDHIQEEINHEMEFVGNDSTVSDLKSLIQELNKFL